MNRQLVESWLQNASLPFGVPRSLNAKGMWSVNVDGADCTLAIHESRDELLLCASLFQLKGTEPVGFYRHLLTLQSLAELPPGLMFGLSEHDNCLMLFGHLSTRALDSSLFDQFLDEAFKAIPFLRRILETMTEEMQQDSPAPSSQDSEVPIQFRDSDADGRSLSDEELLMFQMNQTIHF